MYQISQIHHGLMMVGPSGSGKSSAWRTLLKALENLEGVEGVAHVVDPKVNQINMGFVMFCNTDFQVSFKHLESGPMYIV